MLIGSTHCASCRVIVPEGPNCNQVIILVLHTNYEVEIIIEVEYWCRFILDYRLQFASILSNKSTNVIHERHKFLGVNSISEPHLHLPCERCTWRFLGKSLTWGQLSFLVLLRVRMLPGLRRLRTHTQGSSQWRISGQQHWLDRGIEQTGSWDTIHCGFPRKKYQK